jgi:hypothetical protein
MYFENAVACRITIITEALRIPLSPVSGSQFPRRRFSRWRRNPGKQSLLSRHRRRRHTHAPDQDAREHRSADFQSRRHGRESSEIQLPQRHRCWRPDSARLHRRFHSGKPLWCYSNISKKFTTTSGWSALWIMIWGTSIWRPGARTARKSVRPKSVTYVLGTLCNPCVRAGPLRSGAPGGIRTPDLLVRSQTLYPAELRAHSVIFPSL